MLFTRSRSPRSVRTGTIPATIAAPVTGSTPFDPTHPAWEIGKAQWLRLVDIWLLGPAMMYVGWTGKMPDWWRLASFIGGWYTIVWNLRNYDRVKAVEKLKWVS